MAAKYLFEYIDLAPKCQFKVLTFIFFMGCVKWVAFFFHPKVSIALIVLVNQITTYALLLCHFLLFGYSRKDNIISKERRLIREREMSWQFVNLHPKMYFTKYCFIRNTYYIVLYIICISFECVLVIDWLLLHIYLLGIGTDTDIHVCMSYVFQYLQSMIMHMPQEYRHLILPDMYYFDVSILPERGLIQNYILTKKILNIILVSLLSILITLLGYKIDTT